jgi:hypothetical protein
MEPSPAGSQPSEGSVECNACIPWFLPYESADHAESKIKHPQAPAGAPQIFELIP